MTRSAGHQARARNSAPQQSNANARPACEKAVFPYGVFYTMEGGGAVAWAVLDLIRDPAWLREQLRE